MAVDIAVSVVVGVVFLCEQSHGNDDCLNAKHTFKAISSGKAKFINHFVNDKETYGEHLRREHIALRVLCLSKKLTEFCINPQVTGLTLPVSTLK